MLLKISILSSIFFSLVLLFTDAELWAAAPDHAYVLIALTSADIVLFGLLLFVFSLAAKIAFYFGIFKTFILLGDILTAPQFGLTYAEFAYYLFSLWPFVGLFVSQLGVTLSALVALREMVPLSKSKKSNLVFLVSLFLLLLS